MNPVKQIDSVSELVIPGERSEGERRAGERASEREESDTVTEDVTNQRMPFTQ